MMEGKIVLPTYVFIHLIILLIILLELLYDLENNAISVLILWELDGEMELEGQEIVGRKTPGKAEGERMQKAQSL